MAAENTGSDQKQLNLFLAFFRGSEGMLTRELQKFVGDRPSRAEYAASLGFATAKLASLVGSYDQDQARREALELRVQDRDERIKNLEALNAHLTGVAKSQSETVTLLRAEVDRATAEKKRVVSENHLLVLEVQGLRNDVERLTPAAKKSKQKPTAKQPGVSRGK